MRRNGYKAQQMVMQRLVLKVLGGVFYCFTGADMRILCKTVPTRRLLRALAFCPVTAMLLYAQHTQGPLNDQRIYQLVFAGVSTAEIFRIIATAPDIDFDLRPNSTEAMLKAGVSDDIIRAMAAREAGEPLPPLPRENFRADTQLATEPKSTVSTTNATRVTVSVPGGGADELVTTSASTPKSDGRLRIFVGETSEWQFSSFNVAHSAASYSLFSGSANAGAFGMSHAGLVKLTVSVMNQISQRCTGVVIVERPDLADLFVRLDQSSTIWARHDDMAVFNRAGEMTFVTSTHSISKDVKRFCRNITPR